MRENRSSSLKNLLFEPGSRLSQIAREATRRADLNQRVRQHLPADLAAHVLQISLDEAGCATVTVDSATWATRLHYEQQNLITAIRAQGLTVSRLGIKVLPRG